MRACVALPLLMLAANLLAWLRWGTVTALLILLSLLFVPLPPAALTMVHLLAGLVSLRMIARTAPVRTGV